MIIPSVLFVCTGNICRSPMAQALFLNRLRQSHHNVRDWRVESAGTWAQNGLPATSYAREVMAARGIDISQHLSRVVTAELLAQFDLILVMEPNHKEALCVEFPNLADRIFMLSEMAGQQVPIEDPIGQDLGKYQECANEIDAWIERGWQNIIDKA